MGVTVIVCYRPKPGQAEALDRLACGHVARLYREGLVTRRRPTFMRSGDGSLLEVFEWKSRAAIDRAHENPAVQRMWAEYAGVCSYVPLGALAESAERFAGFESLRLPVEPPPLAHLPNQVQVDRRIGTSGLLTAETLAEVAAGGYRVLIDLLPSSHGHAMADEAARAAKHGMRYVHLPVDFAAPSAADLAAFGAAMDAAGEEAPVWIHCAANYRVSVFTALYGMAKLGWSRARADALIAEVWTPDPTWAAFLDTHANG